MQIRARFLMLVPSRLVKSFLNSGSSKKINLACEDEIQLIPASGHSRTNFYSNLLPPLLIMFRRSQVSSNFIHTLIFIDVGILVLFLFFFWLRWSGDQQRAKNRCHYCSSLVSSPTKRKFLFFVGEGLVPSRISGAHKGLPYNYNCTFYFFFSGSGISSSIPANLLAIWTFFSKSAFARMTNLAPSGEPPPCIQPGTPAPMVAHSTNLAAFTLDSAEKQALRYF